MTNTDSRLTRYLLRCGAIAGPLFIFTVLVQSYTVPGFDACHDLLSLLSLGTYGFVQIANFILAGVLNLAYASASGAGCMGVPPARSPPSLWPSTASS
jgi:Protein of unknown function (DUF998)